MKKSIYLILISLIPIIFLVCGLVTNSIFYPVRAGDGYIWISCIFFPPTFAYCLFKLKIKSENVKRLASYTGVVSLGYLAFAILFKVLHIPGSNYLIVLGISIFVLFFLPLVFRALLLKDS
jgi:hypothetical protein